MKKPCSDFDPYEGTLPSDYAPAQSRLFHRLRLRNEHEEDWACINRDRDRAHEFADFYFGHPALQGWERAMCADLVVESAIDLIEPEPVDDLEPAPDDVAEALMRRLVSDPYTKHYVDSAVRPEMRAAGYYRRIASLYDRVMAEKL